MRVLHFFTNIFILGTLPVISRFWLEHDQSTATKKVPNKTLSYNTNIHDFNVMHRQCLIENKSKRKETVEKYAEVTAMLGAHIQHNTILRTTYKNRIPREMKRERETSDEI